MAVSAFAYPINKVTLPIQQEYIAPLIEGNPIFSIFPIRERDVAEVRVAQKDSVGGLQQFRGLDGEEAHVRRTGENVKTYKPGVFGEFSNVTEEEMTERASTVNPDVPIDVADYVSDIDQDLITRSVQRKAYNGWSALQGLLNLYKPGPNDSVVQQTYAYPVKTYTPTVPFSTLATAVPIAAFQTVQQMQIGLSVDFGAGATAYLNTVTANSILNNANQNDFAGRRGQFGQTLNNVPGLNNYWQGQNLPKLVVIDDGFYPTIEAAKSLTGFQKYIPDGKIIVVGKRPGNVPIGEYTITRCLPRRRGDGGMGDYRYIKDSSVGLNCAVETPPKLSVHRGHSGMASLWFASAVVDMQVF